MNIFRFTAILIYFFLINFSWLNNCFLNFFFIFYNFNYFGCWSWNYFFNFIKFWILKRYEKPLDGWMANWLPNILIEWYSFIFWVCDLAWFNEKSTFVFAKIETSFKKNLLVWEKNYWRYFDALPYLCTYPIHEEKVMSESRIWILNNMDFWFYSSW